MKKRVTDILFPGLTRDNFWKLFLFNIFIFHLWTFYLVFRDVTWVVERFGEWDAVGLVSYALMFALVESLIQKFAEVAKGLMDWNCKSHG